MELNDLHRQMLQAGQFHVDGWTTPRGRQAVAELERAGYIRTFEGGDSQYTSINCEVTDAGRKALRGV